MDLIEHIVRFDQWCDKCKHCELDDIHEPCNECLDNSINTNTMKPVMFEEKD